MRKSRRLENEENEILQGYPGESTIGDQSAREEPAPSTGRRRRQKIETSRRESMVRERIARKAYELYETRGCEPGRDGEDWFEAERLVREEIQAESDRKKRRRRKAPRRAEPR